MYYLNDNKIEEDAVDYYKQLREAVENLIVQKGRHDTETAYSVLEQAYKASNDHLLDNRRRRGITDEQLLGLASAQAGIDTTDPDFDAKLMIYTRAVLSMQMHLHNAVSVDAAKYVPRQRTGCATCSSSPSCRTKCRSCFSIGDGREVLSVYGIEQLAEKSFGWIYDMTGFRELAVGFAKQLISKQNTLDGGNKNDI